MKNFDDMKIVMIKNDRISLSGKQWFCFKPRWIEGSFD